MIAVPRPRAWRPTVVLLLGMLGCSEGSPPTLPPPPPAEPTGTLLLFDPTGPVYVADAATGASEKVSQRRSEPFIWNSTLLYPGGDTVVGFGRGIGETALGIRQLDLSTGLVTTLFLADNVFSTQVSPDGTTLAFAGVGIWEPFRAAVMTMDLATRATTLRFLATKEEPDRYLARLRWLPDQTGFIAYLYQPDSNRVVHFDLTSGAITPITETMPTFPMLSTIDLSRDGKTIVYNTPTGELRFITRSGAPAPGFPTGLRGLFPAFSPDGKLMAWSRFHEGTVTISAVWYYRFSDGAMWRALPEGSPLTWVLDWE